MIGEQARQGSDHELDAKRAIDNAVETLRSLAEGMPSQAAPLLTTDARPRAPLPDETSRPDRTVALQTPVPTGARLREGFHRLGIVFATPCGAAGAGALLLSWLDPAGQRFAPHIGLALLTLAGLTYFFCRALAWVAVGFLGEGVDAGAPAASATAQPERKLRGIGGWLWLPILAVVSIIVLAVERAPAALTIVESAQQNPTTINLFLLGATALSYCVTAAWLYELYLMWRRRALARRFYVALSLTSVAFAAAFAAIWVFYFEVRPGGLLQSAAEELSHAIWIPYMLLSRRVRNTFVN